MKKHSRQRGYFGETVREGASRPARSGKQSSRHTEEHAFVSVPGGLDPKEVLELMGKVRHPVRLDDLIRFLDLSRRDKKPLELLLDALIWPKAGSSGCAGASGSKPRRPAS